MQVIAKRKMQFLRSEIQTHPETNEKMVKIHETFTVQFKPTEIQVCPDWIQDDGLFPLAVLDGTLIVVDGNSGTAVAGSTVPFIGGWNAGK